jgi:L-aspartate oxidase
LNDAECFGCSAYSWDKRENFSFLTNVILIASGGAAGIYSRSTNPHSSTGDGVALAYNSGIETVNMEFIQFHPTAFHSKNGETFLISEAVRGEGAYLVNKDGKRFMRDFHELAELAPRDIVSKGIFDTLKKEQTSQVFLTLSHLDKSKIKKRFKNIYDTLLKYRIDITTDLIPVSPAAHYMIGGINTNLNGETTLSGLYTCGEAAHSGVHGANRLASNSLLECLVFSYRAINDSKKYLDKKWVFDFPQGKYSVDDKFNAEYLNLKNKIQNIMNDYVGIVRSEKNLCHALETISAIDKNWKYENDEYYSDRLKSLKTVSLMIINGALTRKETRGSHIRIDYPEEAKTPYNIYQSSKTGIEEKNHEFK